MFNICAHFISQEISGRPSFDCSLIKIHRFRVAKGSLSTQPQQLSFETAFPVSIPLLNVFLYLSVLVSSNRIQIGVFLSLSPLKLWFVNA